MPKDRMPELLRKLRLFLHRDRFEQDLAEEMRHHLAMKSAAAGDSAAAHRQFGNATALQEESRAMWTWTFWEQFVQDLRYGLRMNFLGTIRAGLALRPAHDARQSVIYGHGRAVPGAGHRREYRHLRLPGLHRDARPPGAASRTTNSNPLAVQGSAGGYQKHERYPPQGCALWREQPQLPLCGLRSLSRRRRCLLDPVRLCLGRQTQHGRRGPGRDPGCRTGVRRLLRRPWRVSRRRPPDP